MCRTCQGVVTAMTKNPILELSLDEVLKPEIAMVLGQVHGVYTVGGFLRAWRNPKRCQRLVEAFDSPTQARQAASVCAAWLGVRSPAFAASAPMTPVGWWAADTEQPALA